MNHFYQLWRFFQAAWTYSTPDDDGADQLSESWLEQASGHLRIVAVAVTLAMAGCFAGIGLVLFDSKEAFRRGFGAIVLPPLVFAAAGLHSGVGLSCLFASTRFLTSSVGRKWMRLIGTESVLLARVVCLILTLISIAVACLLSLEVWRNLH